MKAVFLLLVALIACAKAADVYQAEAFLYGTTNTNFSSIVGIVSFTQDIVSGNVTVAVNISGLGANARPDGLHGIHVHFWGDISDAALALNAGAHWYVAGEQHACENISTRHQGDMGNWQATGGSIAQTKVLDKLTLTGANSILGRAVVLHYQMDDCTNATANGNSGTRIAQGVIGVSNPGAGNNNLAVSKPATMTAGTEDVAICILRPFPGYSISGYSVIRKGPSDAAPQIFIYLDGVAPASVHGVHIHQFGDIRNAAAPGGHWNPFPFNDTHGAPGYPHHHTGDLGNAYFFYPDQANTTLYFNQTTNMSFNVSGGLYSILGLTLIIHEARDNCTPPIGFSGNRMAGCVYGLAFNSSSSILPKAVPTGIPNVQDAQSITDCNNQFMGATTGITSNGMMTSGITAGMMMTTSAADTTSSETSFAVVAQVSLALIAMLVMLL